jgi:hypothetical protein
MFFTHPPLIICSSVVLGTPVSESMMYTRATCTRQALYKRISRWRNSLSSSNKLIIQAIDVARGGVVLTNHAPPEALTPPNTSRTRVIITPATTKALDDIAAVEEKGMSIYSPSQFSSLFFANTNFIHRRAASSFRQCWLNITISCARSN